MNIKTRKILLSGALALVVGVAVYEYKNARDRHFFRRIFKGY